MKSYSSATLLDMVKMQCSDDIIKTTTMLSGNAAIGLHIIMSSSPDSQLHRFISFTAAGREMEDREILLLFALCSANGTQQKIVLTLVLKN